MFRVVHCARYVVHVEDIDIHLYLSVFTCYVLVGGQSLEVYLPLSGLIDREKERLRLQKQAEKLKKEIAALEARLCSKGFADKAKPEVVGEVRATLADRVAQLSAAENSLTGLEV